MKKRGLEGRTKPEEVIEEAFLVDTERSIYASLNRALEISRNSEHREIVSSEDRKNLEETGTYKQLDY